MQEVDPTPEANDDMAGMGTEIEEAGSFLSDISSSIPGIDEAMSFAEVMKQVQSMDYSVIVFDTAPTGHTLRLLQFPTTLEKGLSKLMSLKESFGGALSSVTRLLGSQGADDAMEQLTSKFTQLKSVVEEVNRQFKDPDLTTFVCVCIPEFLSLYETERLVQELARFEIDSRNIVINQIIFPEEVGTSRLLRARVKMQQKYLDQFYDLYEDFHIIKMPLLDEEIRGPEALKAFSKYLLEPYTPPRIDTKAEIELLRKRIDELESS